MEISPDNLFRLLADNTRLRSLMLLVEHSELCVCELTHALGLSQPKISRHLAQLREFGLVSDRREGLWVYYQLQPDLSLWVSAILKETWQANAETSPFANDRQVLLEMPNRPGAPCCA